MDQFIQDNAMHLVMISFRTWYTKGRNSLLCSYYVQKPVYRSTQIVDSIFFLQKIMIYPIQDLLSIWADESF